MSLGDALRASAYPMYANTEKKIIVFLNYNSRAFESCSDLK